VSASVTSLVSHGVPPGVVRTASELATTPADHAAERVLPVRAELAALLPFGGLRRGSTVVVRGSTSLLLALLAVATTNGSWAAVVGVPDLGVLAAAGLGVEVSRLALVPRPGAELAGVTAALLDGVDLVVVASALLARLPGPDSVARRLSARARHRSAVLLAFGSWPGADLELDCTPLRWSGLGPGHGYLAAATTTVTARGRGAATRSRQLDWTLPVPSHLPAPRVADGEPSRPIVPVPAGAKAV
jgi:hypothetical protein